MNADNKHDAHAHPGDETRRVAPIVGWGLVLAILLAGGRYRIFLRPEFGWLLAVSFALLCLLLVAVCIDPVWWRTAPRRSAARLGRVAVVFLPLVFIVLTKGYPLGAYAFDLKKLDASLPEVPEVAEPPEAADGPPVAVDLGAIRSEFRRLYNRRVQTVGSVARDEPAGPGTLSLFRFRITCCAADARPVSVAVWAEGTEAIREDAWVRATGRLRRVLVDGRGTPVIVAETVEPVEPPADPYLR